MKRRHQRGNALWLILIAIFLLGALTMLIAKTSSQTDETGQEERYRIAASQIVREASGVANAVQKLYGQGCSETQISFENNVATGYENPDAPPDKSCHVFDPAGGGLRWPLPPTGSDFGDYYAHDDEFLHPRYLFTSMRSGAINDWTEDVFGTSESDLMMLLRLPARGLCTAVNKMAGVPLNIPPSWGGVDPVKFTGTYDTGAAGVLNNNKNTWRMPKFGCLETNCAYGAPNIECTNESSDWRWFYMLLLPR